MHVISLAFKNRLALQLRMKDETSKGVFSLVGKDQNSLSQTNWRLVIVFALAVLAFISLITRLGWIQLIRGAELQQEAWKQWSQDINIEAQRGEILDRNGEILTGNVTSSKIFAYPEEIQSVDTAAAEVSRIFGIDYDKVKDKLQEDTTRVELMETSDAEFGRIIQDKEAIHLPGIERKTDSGRYYPHESMASQVLGFVGDEQGWSGLEYEYEEELAGKDGWMLHQISPDMKEIPHGEGQFVPPKDGKDLKTTLDVNIQYVLERELEKALEEHEAKNAMALVMDPNNGEVLAMGSKPDYHPADYQDYEGQKRQNPLIENSFEPGSTFKPTTLSASIEENNFDPNRGFHSTGTIDVAGTTISCWSGGHDEMLDFREVVYRSSNPGFVVMGQELGKETLMRYIQGLGYGERTGIDLPGESRGSIPELEQKGPVELATVSFGQGVSVTPIQQAVALSAIANEGEIVTPYVGKKLMGEAETEQNLGENKKVRQAISEITANKATDILEGVVEEGTGDNAQIEGINVAGKTGTAQKPAPDGGYYEDKYIASFIGFAPANDPELLVYVAVDTPQTYPPWGGHIAAPVFREIMKDSLNFFRD